MTFHRSARRAVAAAFALTLLVAACGGDDDGSEDKPDSTTTTAAADDSTTTTAGDDGSTTTTTEGEDDPDVEEAEELAESINLTIDDFADGWEAEPAEDDGDDELQACFQDVSIDDVEVASVESPTFSISTDDGTQGQVVQTSTVVTDEEASAEAIVAEVATNQFAGCAEDAIVASIEEDGGEMTSSGLDPVEDQGGLGDGSAGIAGAISFTTPDGTEAEGQLALFLIRTENVVTAMTLLDIGDLAYEDTLTDLLEAVANRQAENV